MEERSRCSENMQHSKYDIKPGSQKDILEKVIFKLGAEGGREGCTRQKLVRAGGQGTVHAKALGHEGTRLA